MLSVLCVLKSGGVYSAEWVAKLQRGIERNLDRPHRFVCLSDIEVPCERIPLENDWPGWWSKIALFKPGVITGPSLYLDLDTILSGPINVTELLNNGPDFAMLQNFWVEDMVGSGVMWFSGENVPHQVYSKFVRQPDAYIAHYARNENGPYIGDQAFIFDTLGRDVPFINDYLTGIKSYKLHCKRRLPEDASIICFHGVPRPSEVKAEWMERHWA